MPSHLATHLQGRGPRVAMVHGFAQTSACWGPLLDDLAADHEVVAVDAPGHGESADVSTDLWGAGDLIAAAGGAATYVGYSMGGRMCLHAAIAHPREVEGLVLISATAGIDHPTGRRQRIRSDEVLARRIEADGVPAFVEAWLSNPLFAGVPPEHRFEAERATNTAAGLADHLRRCGTGQQQGLWARLGELSMPVLVVVGAEDAKYAAIGERMVRGIGSWASLAVIDGAGHSPHLERADATIAAIRAWLG